MLGAALLKWFRRHSPCTLWQVPLAGHRLLADKLSVKTPSVSMTEPIVPPPLTLPEDCNEAARGRLALNDAVEILVVEDDRLIQAMVEEALSDGGFASALTASGEEAITLLQDDKSKYRAVVTDINLLGKLDGWEVGRSAREIDPTMPVIYMTGTHGEEWASKGVPNSLLLVKPSPLLRS